MKKVREITFVAEESGPGTEWMRHFLIKLIMKELDFPLTLSAKVIHDLSHDLYKDKE